MPEEKSFSTEIPRHSHSCLEIFAPDEIMIMMIYDAQYVMGRFFILRFFFLLVKLHTWCFVCKKIETSSISNFTVTTNKQKK